MPRHRTVYLLTKTRPERRRSSSAEDAETEVGDRAMARERHIKSFYLIITDKDNGTFCVEGPMTDDRLGNHAVIVAQKLGRQVRCSTASGLSAEDPATTW